MSARDEDEQFGTAEDYMRALQSALTDAHPKHREMLLAHFNAPHHTTTWAQLAEKVGYKEGRAVNLQDGKFGERVARQLGLNDKPLDPYGNGWWVWCLVRLGRRTRSQQRPYGFRVAARSSHGLGTLGLWTWPR